jgi:hypothetical protein
MSDDDISSPHVHIIPTPRTYIITNINMVRLVDPAKFAKLVKVVRLAPNLFIPDAMKLAEYSNDEIADLSFRRLLQRRLRGGSLDSFRAIVRAEEAPPLNRNERHKSRRDERTPPPKRTPPPIEQPPPPAVDHMARPPELTPPPAVELAQAATLSVTRDDASRHGATRCDGQRSYVVCDATTRSDARRCDVTQRDATRRGDGDGDERQNVARRDATRDDATRCDATRRGDGDGDKRQNTARRDATRDDATRRDLAMVTATSDRTRRDAMRRETMQRDATWRW